MVHIQTKKDLIAQVLFTNQRRGTWVNVYTKDINNLQNLGESYTRLAKKYALMHDNLKKITHHEETHYDLRYIRTTPINKQQSAFKKFNEV